MSNIPQPTTTTTTSSTSPTARAVRRLNRDRREEMLVGYLFVLPDVLGLLVFIVGPMLFALYISLNEWSGFTTPTFVGLENYVNMASDPRFWASLRRTATSSSPASQRRPMETMAGATMSRYTSSRS